MVKYTCSTLAVTVCLTKTIPKCSVLLEWLASVNTNVISMHLIVHVHVHVQLYLCTIQLQFFIHVLIQHCTNRIHVHVVHCTFMLYLKVFDQYLNFISLEEDLFITRHQDKTDISYYGLYTYVIITYLQYVIRTHVLFLTTCFFIITHVYLLQHSIVQMPRTLISMLLRTSLLSLCSLCL